MMAGWRRRVAGVTAALAMTVVAAAGCGQTIPGVPEPVGASEPANTNFDKLLRECEVVDAAKIGEIVGKAQIVEGSFLGAVCMWDIHDAPGGMAMVTLNWYELGTLNNEKITNDKLGYLSESVMVQSSRALQTRRPNDPHSCGVSASAADSGVVGWWINYRPGSAHPDPCAAAKALLELTLNLAR